MVSEPRVLSTVSLSSEVLSVSLMVPTTMSPMVDLTTRLSAVVEIEPSSTSPKAEDPMVELAPVASAPETVPATLTPSLPSSVEPPPSTIPLLVVIVPPATISEPSFTVTSEGPVIFTSPVSAVTSVLVSVLPYLAWEELAVMLTSPSSETSVESVSVLFTEPAVTLRSCPATISEPEMVLPLVAAISTAPSAWSVESVTFSFTPSAILISPPASIPESAT